MSQLQPISNYPTRYKQGGKISFVSTTTLSISACLTRSLTDDYDINVGDWFGAQTVTTLNAAVVGLNGLDTGALAASTVYAVYAIADQAGYHIPGFIMSANQSVPFMPTGYSTYVRIGWWVTDGSSNLMDMKVSGSGTVVSYFYRVAPTAVTSGSATSLTAINLSTMVPAVDGILTTFGGTLAAATAGRSAEVAPYSTTGNSNVLWSNPVASINENYRFDMPVPLNSGVPTIWYLVGNADADLQLQVCGFTDYLL